MSALTESTVYAIVPPKAWILALPDSYSSPTFYNYADGQSFKVLGSNYS